jgi:N-acetyl-anhydromuramyl-L-alanine amidase AmpD
MTTVLDWTARTDGRLYNDRPNGAASIAGIILHHTGSTSEDGDYNWLSRESALDSLRRFGDLRAGVSTTQLVKRNGTIIQVVSNEKRAWHAGLSLWRGKEDANDWSLGIEICNSGHAEIYTETQKKAVAETVAYNCARYRIHDDMVVSHKAIRAAWLRAHPGTADEKYDPFAWNWADMWHRVDRIRADWPFRDVPMWCCMGEGRYTD